MKNKKTIKIIFLIILTFLFRFPSLFEPAWHRDEGITLVVGKAIKNGAILYKDIADNKTPLLYYLSSVFDSVFKLKTLLFVWQSLFIIFFYFLAQKLLSKKGALVSSIFVVFLVNTPLLEGNIANGEIFFILPVVLGFLFFLKGKNNLQNNNLFFLLSGILFGVGFLFKQASFFDFLVCLLLLLFFFEQKYNKFLFLLGGFLLPLSFTVIHFAFLGNLKDFWKYGFLWNLAYSSYNNFLIIPYGKTIFLFFFFSVCLFFLFLLRQKIKFPLSFSFIWFLGDFLGSQISQRGYLHYYLPLTLPLSLFLGVIFDYKKKLFFLLVILLTFFMIKFNPFNLEYSFRYYQNFINLFLKNNNINTYRNFFDPMVAFNYQIAEFLKNKKGEIFVWGDEPFFYLLSEKQPPVKFPVAYNIVFSAERKKETLAKISLKPPQYIIIVNPVKFNFEELFEFIENKYLLKYQIGPSDIYERKN